MSIGLNEIKNLIININKLDRSGDIEIKKFHLEKITGGLINDVYDLSISYQKEGEEFNKELIVKCFHDKEAIKSSQKEFLVMDKLYNLAFMVPKVYLLSSNNDNSNSSMLFMEKINGETLLNELSKVTNIKKFRLMAMFCENLVKIHNIEIDEFKSILEFDPTCDSLSSIRNDLKRAKDNIESCKNKELDNVVNWLERNVSKLNSEKLSLLHGDYHLLNVLVEKDAGVIIDWSNARIGDYRIDLATTILINHDMREIILNLYEKINGRKVESIEYFEALQASVFLYLILSENNYRNITTPIINKRYDLNYIQFLCNLINRVTGIDIDASQYI